MADSFPEVPKIQYGGPKSRNPLEFKHYNADEIIDGKTLKEHLRFSVVYWHTFCNALSDPFGVGTALRPWDDGSNSLANARRKAQVAFEFFEKLGILSTRSTIATSRRKARISRKATPISTRSPRSSRTSKRGPASSCSGEPPTFSPIPATCTERPPARILTYSRLPAHRSRRRWR